MLLEWSIKMNCISYSFSLWQFKVVWVKDAITYFAKIIRYRDTSGILHHIQSNKFKLDLSLQSFFAQYHVNISIDPASIEKDKLCVYEKDKIYYRYMCSSLFSIW